MKKNEAGERHRVTRGDLGRDPRQHGKQWAVLSSGKSPEFMILLASVSTLTKLGYVPRLSLSVIYLPQTAFPGDSLSWAASTGDCIFGTDRPGWGYSEEN